MFIKKLVQGEIQEWQDFGGIINDQAVQLHGRSVSEKILAVEVELTDIGASHLCNEKSMDRELGVSCPTIIWILLNGREPKKNNLTCLINELRVEWPILTFGDCLDIGVLLDNPVLLLKVVQEIPKDPDHFIDFDRCAPDDLDHLRWVIIL